MNNLDFEECIIEYDSLIEKNIIVEKILTTEQLHILDRLIYNHIDKTWKKVALIIGKVFIDLEKNEQLYFFSEYQEYADLLINQRMVYLEQIFRIKVNGNIKAMRFSEVITFSQDLILLEQNLFLLRFDNHKDTSLSFKMVDIIASGLKEQLRLQGEEINDTYIEQQALAFIQEQKEREHSQFENSAIVYHIKEGVSHLKQQINYGNNALEPIYYYLNDIVKYHNYTPTINRLSEAFPIKNTICLPQTISIKNKDYHLKNFSQKHKTGCSIACISMVTGVDYDSVLIQVKELFNWPKNRSKFGLTTEQIALVLSHYSIAHKEISYDSSWKNCSDLAICLIDLDMTGRYFHNVIFCRINGKDYIIDPYFNNAIRIDLYNMKLESFINIG